MPEIRDLNSGVGEAHVARGVSLDVFVTTPASSGKVRQNQYPPAESGRIAGRADRY
jgi:hypothetical protein